jgi:ABC-type Mn2+/Zn2+ transport system ATPase subunit
VAELLIRPETHDRALLPLQVKDLTVRYNGSAALQKLSFHLSAGVRVAVVGPNGAGKTTLLKVLAGAMRPSSGSVMVYGRKPGGHVCIAYVPQRSQVDWVFPVTVAEVVMMGRIRRIGLFRFPGRADWQVVDRALERVGMAGLRGERIGELSGGQQQRVFLAQALAQEAELILLDEPLTGLDLPSQDAIFRLLDELREQGIPVMVATHDLNLAAERFDAILLLNRRLVAIGPAKEVLTREHLEQTYGDHIHLLPEGEGMLVLADTCCEGGEEGGAG